MKILSIGNSFSEDAQRWLHDISLCGNTRIDTTNLYIGGCTLETHYNNIRGNKYDYSFQGNGIKHIKSSSINAALSEDKYDIITVQQASGFSGIPQSYIPFLTEIVSYIKEKQPGAKIYFHETWSYETNSTHGDFAFYNKDQREMKRRISDCAEMVKKLAGLDILPVGDFIQYLRENTAEFDYANGGISLCRDGFHLLETYGRFAAAAVWYKELAGEKVNGELFVKDNPDFDPDLVTVIIDNLERFYAGR